MTLKVISLILVILQCFGVAVWLIMNLDNLGRPIVVPALLVEGVFSFWLIGVIMPPTEGA